MPRNADGTLGARRPTLRSILGVPFRLQTYRNLLYLSLAFPLGLAYFVAFTVGFSVSLGLTLVLVGIPMLVAMIAVVVACIWFESLLTSLLLGVDIERAVLPSGDQDSLLDTLRATVVNRQTWTGLVYLVSKFFVGVAAFVLLTVLLVTSLVVLAVPLYYRSEQVGVLLTDGPIQLTPSLYLPWDQLMIGVDAVVYLTTWRIDTLPEALLMSGVGVLMLVASLNVFNGLAWLYGKYARLMLGSPQLPFGTENAADTA
jgi:hypothetical protein